jgi:predicted HicB family RNase H-like nuclease
MKLNGVRVDDYIEWCLEEGVQPEKPYSGNFNVRLPPSLHRETAITAQKLKISTSLPALKGGEAC